jgi:fructokinase
LRAITLGEVLWDVIGDTEHLGGAPFNFSAHLARLGHSVNFVSAVGEDERGERVLARMAQLNLPATYVRSTPDYPTGVVTVSFVSGRTHYQIERPAAYDFPQLSPAQAVQLLSVPADWIYFGTLQQLSPQAKQVTFDVLARTGAARRFYDVNLRTGNWEPSLVNELIAQASVVKLNDEEVNDIAGVCGLPSNSLEDFCRAAARKFHLQAVCVTRGASGCAALLGDEYVESEGYSITMVDPVGAGDAFAAAFVHGWSSGWQPGDICDFANRVGALVASRAGAIPDWTVTEVRTLQRTTAPPTIQP